MAKKEITKVEDTKDKVEVVKESLIISPRLTEKASNLSTNNVYTFNVKSNATKGNLAKEIEKTYKVKPVKITIINQPRKAVFSRGKLGYKSAFKKASIFLKKGDKLNLA